ncbi:hypothetical protein EHS25_005117 [Saitozyma podzolica]|uniref:Mitochondrial outer membrane protein OM14 C-terminal domain-containing protein n=1 Tax=Saitozyma podzolica TaxID=1890683 RepID=A0A427Y2K2_9TREE|nr:hypothetical protein EHS25_005117 [Saitozyma podzolica]
MSYASVASHNLPPEEEQPKPDPTLLDGHFQGETPAHVDVDSKINVLPAGSDPNKPDIHPEPAPHPEPVTLNPAPVPEPHVSEVAPTPLPAPSKADIKLPEIEAHEQKLANRAKAEKEEIKKDVKGGFRKAEKKGKEYAKKAEKEFEEVESRLAPYWEKTKDVVLRPGTLGGLMGVVNVGLLGTIGYFAYTRKDQPWDRRIVGGAVAGTLALFGAEGYVAESYLQTPEGREEAERAKQEGSKLYLQAKEVILRPQVAGGLVGAFNLAIIGAVGYVSYRHWNQPWDRRIVSSVAVGLLGLSGLEGWAGKVYKDKELPKH